MNKTLGFKVTVEFILPDMIDEDTFRNHYNSDAFACYKFISNNFNDSPINFSTSDKIVKIELLEHNE